MKPSPAGRSLGPTYLPLGVKYSGQHLTEHHIARGAHSACTQCEGELDESIWKKLEDEMLADRATIAHHHAHLADVARDGEKAAALAKRHGASTAVEAFVGRTVKETVINEDRTTEVKAIERVNKQHLVQALLMPSRPQRRHVERAQQEEVHIALRRVNQPRPDSLRGDDDAR